MSKKNLTRDSFAVPSWMDATLSGSRDVIPEQKGFDYRKEFKDQSGDTALLTRDNKRKIVYTAPFMKEVVELEEAKHYAAECTSKLILATGAEEFQAAQAVKQSQRDASLKRLALIERLVSSKSNLFVTTNKSGVSVTYNSYASSNGVILNQTQSQYAWNLPDKSVDVWTSLIYDDKDDHEKSSDWTDLLTAAISTCPRKEWSEVLLNAVKELAADDEPDLVFKKTGYRPFLGMDQWSAPEPTSTAFEEFVADDDTIKIIGLIGMFNVNKMDHRQSSRINTVIQKTILKGTSDYINAMRSQDTDHNHLNTMNITIKIESDLTTHVLTFRPFAGHEACTATHFFIKQEFTPASREDLGIIRIPDSIYDIAPLHVYQIAPEQGIVCIGAYRNCRFNEQELNAIHGSGIVLTTSGYTDFKFPKIDSIDYDSNTPFAKAVRTSCDGWDILTTSFKHKNVMHTVITTINYPPFGTQIHYAERDEPAPSLPGGGHRFTAPSLPGGGHRSTTHTQRPKKEDKWLKDSDKNFFVRGIVGSPFDERFYMELIAINDDVKRHQMRERAVEIRNTISAAYSTVWDSALNFYENLEQNDNVPHGQDGPMREVWSGEWKETIRNDIESWDVRGEQIFNLPGGDVYWWTYDTSGRVWESIIPDVALRSKWLLFLNTLEVEANIQPKHLPVLAGRSKYDMIKLPRRQAPIPKSATSKPTPEITQMQARLRALEAKLDQSRQEANNTHLLQEVLAKLDRPSALRY